MDRHFYGDGSLRNDAAVQRAGCCRGFELERTHWPSRAGVVEGCVSGGFGGAAAPGFQAALALRALLGTKTKIFPRRRTASVAGVPRGTDTKGICHLRPKEADATPVGLSLILWA